MLEASEDQADAPRGEVAADADRSLAAEALDSQLDVLAVPAAAFAQEDLKAIMRAVIDINHQKEEQRKRLSQAQEDAAGNAGMRRETSSSLSSDGPTDSSADSTTKNAPDHGEPIALDAVAASAAPGDGSLAELSALRLQMYMDRYAKYLQVLANLEYRAAETVRGIIANLVGDGRDAGGSSSEGGEGTGGDRPPEPARIVDHAWRTSPRSSPSSASDCWRCLPRRRLVRVRRQASQARCLASATQARRSASPLLKRESVPPRAAPQEAQMSFNLQYLQLQSQMQYENRSYTAVSNIMPTSHDTAANSISNIRGEDAPVQPTRSDVAMVEVDREGDGDGVRRPGRTRAVAGASAILVILVIVAVIGAMGTPLPGQSPAPVAQAGSAGATESVAPTVAPTSRENPTPQSRRRRRSRRRRVPETSIR